VTELCDLGEAISHYISIAALKLRKQNSVASAVCVYLQTHLLKDKQQQDGNSMMLPLTTPTADTSHLIHAAKQGLHHIYQKGHRYKKAGIILMDISQQHIRQFDMLSETIHPKSEQLMSTMDAINKIMGKNTVFLAAEGITRAWALKCDRRSPRYTTRWDELPIVNC
jgi:DNA polymerase V